MRWDGFLASLGRWLERRELLGRGAGWVVGASGGPDSTLLLHGLASLSKRHSLGWTLHAAHLDHGLRGTEAEADARFVAGQAERIGAVFHVQRTDVRGAAAAAGRSIEEAARRLRYEFLERVALRTGSLVVAVGHHADDNAETVLHRICRGTGLRGLAGIAEMRPIRPRSHIRLVRPLLSYSRTTIANLCATVGLEVRTDSSNESVKFTRNRIRRLVLPLLRDALNPHVAEALLRLSQQARWAGAYLAEAGARAFDALVAVEEPDRLALNAPALLSQHRAIQAEIVRQALARILGGEQDVSFAHVEAVLQLADDVASGKELHLPGAIVATKRYDRLEFRPRETEEATPEPAPVFVTCPGVTALPALSAELETEACSTEPAYIEELRRRPTAHEAWVDLDRLQPPLFVRARRGGDRFHPLGAPGPKRVSDFLSDEKIDPAVRARVCLLCDGAGPVWVIPWRIDERVKLSETTRRALHFTLRATDAAPTSIP